MWSPITLMKQQYCCGRAAAKRRGLAGTGGLPAVTRGGGRPTGTAPGLPFLPRLLSLLLAPLCSSGAQPRSDSRRSPGCRGCVSGLAQCWCRGGGCRGTRGWASGAGPARNVPVRRCHGNPRAPAAALPRCSARKCQHVSPVGLGAAGTGWGLRVPGGGCEYQTQWSGCVRVCG